MEKVLTVFIVAFFAVSVVSLVVSIFRGKEKNLSENCRQTSWMAFFIGLILLYLQFVLT